MRNDSRCGQKHCSSLINWEIIVFSIGNDAFSTPKQIQTHHSFVTTFQIGDPVRTVAQLLSGYTPDMSIAPNTVDDDDDEEVRKSGNFVLYIRSFTDD